MSFAISDSHLFQGFCRQYGIFFSLALLLTLGGCASNQSAPVIDRADKSAVKTKSNARDTDVDWRPDTYVVKKGDTLFSIALEHGLDYKEIAAWNHIENFNVIRLGQRLKFKQSENGPVITALKSPGETKAIAGEGLVKSQPVAEKVPYSDQAFAQASTKKVVVATQTKTPPVVVPATVAEKPAMKATEEKPDQTGQVVSDDQVDWIWPAQGKLIAGFNDAGGAKGLDISGKSGQSVFASAPGKVVYSGSGLRGYGKLIIIKHNKTFLSAYAHNSRILVKEGQSVTKGQKIGEMGDTDSDQIKLHFEIRRLGKPVDPMKYLPGDKTS